MDDQTTWLSVLVAWGPMILLIAVWVYVARRQGWGFGGRMTYAQYLEELLVENRRQGERLGLLLERMDQRLSRLEDRDGKGPGAAS